MPRIAHLFIALCLAFACGHATALSWPSDVTIDSGVVTIYQPQVDSLEGDKLKARAAVAYKPASGGEPVFGAIWLEARVEVDREERTVLPVDVKVPEVRFPEGNETAAEQFRQTVETEHGSWPLAMSLDQLLTSLGATEEAVKQAENLSTKPPEIVYRDHPALLVTIDGDPVTHDIENSNYEAVINTPYPLIKDGRTYWLNAADGVWYQAGRATGPYSFAANPPAAITGLVSQADKADAGSEEAGSNVTITADNAPEIVVATEPTELVVTEGAPEMDPVVDGLLAVKNSDSHIFFDVDGQLYYIVLSGRWYSSKSLSGRWSYVAADALPEVFASIPTEDERADARAYVAGTDEAHEAVMDAQIPQTAKVERGAVDIDVNYDGKPKWEPIKNTSLELAVNASETVMRAGTSYYLVKDGVWYISGGPNGPWEVSDHAPESVENIPADNPAYNTKYVHVYESTPQYVYVGYTPGYMGSYVYGPTVVWGTGWYYRPWISPAYYYPRYSTWGFNVSYNPWTGWGFGLSWNYGPFHFGFQSGGYWHANNPWYYGPGHGYWGPGGYRPHYGGNYIHNDIDININNSFNNLDLKRSNNLYKARDQVARVDATQTARPIDREGLAQARDRAGGAAAAAGISREDLGQARDRVASGEVSREQLANRAQNLPADTRDRANNVFTDKQGNVLRQNGDQWQQYDKGQWRDTSVGQTAQTRPAQNRPSTQPATRPSTTTRPTTRPATTTSRPSTRPATPSYSRPSSSGYSRPSSMQRQSYSRQRANTRARSAPSRGGRRR